MVWVHERTILFSYTNINKLENKEHMKQNITVNDGIPKKLYSDNKLTFNDISTDFLIIMLLSGRMSSSKQDCRAIFSSILWSVNVSADSIASPISNLHSPRFMSLTGELRICREIRSSFRHTRAGLTWKLKTYKTLSDSVCTAVQVMSWIKQVMVMEAETFNPLHTTRQIYQVAYLY
jgi:hypothetical protein